jgi:hypothetical protein
MKSLHKNRQICTTGKDEYSGIIMEWWNIGMMMGPHDNGMMG